jgi:hypothetical protein
MTSALLALLIQIDCKTGSPGLAVSQRSQGKVESKRTFKLRGTNELMSHSIFAPVPVQYRGIGRGLRHSDTNDLANWLGSMAAENGSEMAVGSGDQVTYKDLCPFEGSGLRTQFPDKVNQPRMGSTLVFP